MKKQYFSLLLGILMFLSTFTAGAAASSTSSPWGDWRKAFQAYDKAEEHKDAGEFAQALIYYTQGRDYFSAIRKNFPDWNSKVVSERVKLCEKRMAEMKSRTGKSSGTSTAARSKKKKTRPRKNPPKYSTAEERPIPESDNDDSSAAAAPAAQGRLMLEMQSEIDQYRQRLRKALVEIDNLQVKLRQSEARARDVEGVLRENRLLQEKYSLLEMQYKDLQSRNNGVDRERHEAQLLSLQQANDEALKQIKILEETIRQKDQE